MSRDAFLIIIAAMIAGAIGFGIAVYAVPLEEIVQFRALIDAGLDPLSSTSHPDNSNIVKLPTSPPSKVSTELDSLARDRSEAGLSCDPRCLGGSPTKKITPNEVPCRDEAKENRQQNESGGRPQAPPSTSEPASVPCLSPNRAGEKAHVAPGTHLKPRTKNARGKSSSPRSASEN